MSLRGKQTKWRRLLWPRAKALTRGVLTAREFNDKANCAHEELSAVAKRFYRLGRAAGIAEGRRRASTPAYDTDTERGRTA